MRRHSTLSLAAALALAPLLTLSLAGCGDDGGGPSPDGGGDPDAAEAPADAAGDADAAGPGDDAAPDDTGPPRFRAMPASLSGFGYETVTVSDLECAWPDEPLEATVQGVTAVLVEVEGCDLRFDPQGGHGGPAPIAVTTADGAEVATVEGFSYRPAVDDQLFASPWCIGDSLGAAMVSWYLSYDAQVRDGMFAFFYRQASAPCPHPLVRPEGVPFVVGLDMVDPVTGEVPQEALITDEMLEFVLGAKVGADLRLDPGGTACNQSIPGMHDVMWPFLPVIFEASEIIGLYEQLLRFPFGVPDDAAPILDVIEGGDPTFIVVSPGVAAYALDAVHVEPEQLDADLDAFLQRLADMPSAPVVLLATMPDTASLPGRPFHYAERYYNMAIDDALYRAVDRINAPLEAPRFFVAPTGELYIRWMAATEGQPLDVGGVDYETTVDPSGRVRILVPGSEGTQESLGLGRFQGFFSLDHVHLTPTGHALVANVLIHALNQAIGPEGAHPRMAEAVPLVDIAPIVDRDHEKGSVLEAEAAELGYPELAAFLDPLPPPFGIAEVCTLNHGPFAGVPSGMPCPATVEIVDQADGLPCADEALTLPATLEVRVTDLAGYPIANAAVGVTALPTANHELLAYLPGGVTDDDGRLVVTVDAEAVGAQPGGRLQAQAGAITGSCVLPAAQ